MFVYLVWLTYCVHLEVSKNTNIKPKRIVPMGGITLNMIPQKYIQKGNKKEEMF
jgi:hypothetical protein